MTITKKLLIGASVVVFVFGMSAIASNSRETALPATTQATATQATTTTRATTTTQSTTTTQATTTTKAVVDEMAIAIDYLRSGGWFDGDSDQDVKDVILGACIDAYEADSAEDWLWDMILTFPDDAAFMGAVVGTVAAGELCPTDAMNERMFEVFLYGTTFSDG